MADNITYISPAEWGAGQWKRYSAITQSQCCEVGRDMGTQVWPILHILPDIAAEKKGPPGAGGFQGINKGGNGCLGLIKGVSWV